MTNNDDGRRTLPLPGNPPAPERGTLPLPGASPQPAPGAERATLPLSGTSSETMPDEERATLRLAGETTARSDSEPLPEKIGRFVVRAWLGSGAFGDVYRAYDPQLDREVALKVAKPGTLDTPERVGRFLREAKAAANLRHPNIVPLYETGRDGDRLFIAAAFIPGRTLEAVVREANEKGEPIPLAVATGIVRKLAHALAYAHSQGVVHRDVKPANVMIDDKGEPSLLDFGLAARAESGDERLTQDGQGMGTPAYMAPEQAEGNGTAASDQYSLGCALYELVTGRTPFAGGPAQQIFLHKTQPVASPQSMRREVPRDLDTLVLKCVEKEALRRYANCGDLAEDLRRFLDGEPVRARRIGPVERFSRWCKRNPVVASSVSFGMLALLIGAVVALWQADEARWQEKLARDSTKQAQDAATDAGVKKQLADDKAAEAARSAKLASEQAKLATDRGNDLARTVTQRDQALTASERRRSEAEDRAALNAIVFASRAYDNGDRNNAIVWLDRVPPANRRFDWWHLRERLDDPGIPLYGAEGSVASVLPDPAGLYLIALTTSPRQHVLTAWNPSTREMIWRRFGPTTLKRPAASPDGGWCAVPIGSVLEVWDAYTADHKRTLEIPIAAPQPGANDRSVDAVAFSPDGVTLAAATRNRVVVWDTATWRVVRQAAAPEGATLAFGFTSDGRNLYRSCSAHTGEKTTVWDVGSGRVASRADEALLAVSPAGHQCVVDSGGWAQLRDFRTWAVLSYLLHPSEPGRYVPAKIPQSSSSNGTEQIPLSFSSDGSSLTGVVGPLVTQWAAGSGSVLSHAPGPHGTPTAVAHSGNGVWVVTGWSDGVVRLRPPSATPPAYDRALRRPHETVSEKVEMGFGPSPDQFYIVTGKELHVHETATRQRLLTFPGKDGLGANAGPMVPCGSGARVAVPFPARGITRTFDVRTGKQLAEVPGGRPLFDPQGSVLVTARDQRPGETRHWWDAATGELLWESPGAVLAFSADGTRALLTAPGAARTVLTVREARTGKVIAEFPPCADPRVGRFSLDGNRIVTHHASGRIAVRDVATCAVVWESAAFAGTVKELRYDPRAERVVALTDTGLVGGDVSDESGKLESVTLERGRGRITERLAPDGSRLVDAKGGLYDTRTGARIMGLALQTSECCPGGLAWSSDGTRLGALDFHMNTGDGLSVLAPLNGQRRVIDLRGHDKVDNFDYPLNKGTVRTAMFDPRGATVLTASADGTARLWDARTGAELHVMDVGRSVREPVAFARFSKDGTLIITGQDQSAQIKVWDAASGKLVAAMAHPQGFMVNGRNADFSTDGTRVKCRNTTAQPPQVSIHEARSGALLYWAEGNKVRFVKPGHERADAEFQQHSEEPRVSPDGRDRLLVTGSTVLVVDNRPDAALRSLDAWMSPEGRAQWHWQHGMSGDKFAGDFHRMQARVARCEAAVLACFRMIGVRVDARRLLAFARPAQEWLPGDRRAVAWTRWSYAGGYFEYDGAGRWIEADRNGRRAFREQAATEEYVEIFDDSRDIGVRLYWDRMTLKQPRATEYVRFRPGAWEQTVARIFRAPPPRLVEH